MSMNDIGLGFFELGDRSVGHAWMKNRVRFRSWDVREGVVLIRTWQSLGRITFFARILENFRDISKSDFHPAL